MVVSECDPEKEHDEESGDKGPFDGVSGLRKEISIIVTIRLSRSNLLENTTTTFYRSGSQAYPLGLE
jgi:hypothetical protein